MLITYLSHACHMLVTCCSELLSLGATWSAGVFSFVSCHAQLCGDLAGEGVWLSCGRHVTLLLCQENGIMTRIELNKPVYLEPRRKVEFNAVG